MAIAKEQWHVRGGRIQNVVVNEISEMFVPRAANRSKFQEIHVLTATCSEVTIKHWQTPWCTRRSVMTWERWPFFLPLEAEWEIERIAEALGVLARSIGRLEEIYYALHSCVKPLKSIKRRPRLLTGDMIILVSTRQSALLWTLFFFVLNQGTFGISESSSSEYDML